MRKIVICCLIFFLTLGSSFASISEGKSYTSEMTSIENYLIQHKRDIKKYIEIYELEEKDLISQNLKRIEKLINYIRRAKNKRLNDAEKLLVIQYFHTEIKKINKDLRNELNLKKESFNRSLQEKINKNYHICIALADKLEYLTEVLYKKRIAGKVPYTKQQQALLTSIKELRKNIASLRLYDKINFSDTREANYYIKRLLKQIKHNMNELKKAI